MVFFQVGTILIVHILQFVFNPGPELLSLSNNLIKEPKQRSKKWISTSYRPEEWDLETSQFASGEYFTHNLLVSK